MTDEIMLTIGEDGKASLYDDTYDITIHCESKEEQDEVKRVLENIPHWIPVDLENNEPQLEEWVLVSSDGYVMQDCIVERGGKKIWYHGGNIQADDRYMPLPEPYKGVTT